MSVYLFWYGDPGFQGSIANRGSPTFAVRKWKVQLSIGLHTPSHRPVPKLA